MKICALNGFLIGGDFSAKRSVSVSYMRDSTVLSHEKAQLLKDGSLRKNCHRNTGSI